MTQLWTLANVRGDSALLVVSIVASDPAEWADRTDADLHVDWYGDEHALGRSLWNAGNTGQVVWSIVYKMTRTEPPQLVRTIRGGVQLTHADDLWAALALEAERIAGMFGSVQPSSVAVATTNEPKPTQEQS